MGSAALRLPLVIGDQDRAGHDHLNRLVLCHKLDKSAFISYGTLLRQMKRMGRTVQLFLTTDVVESLEEGAPASQER